MNEAYDNLRIGILAQAAKDWRDAKAKNYPAKAAKIERFFLSDYGQLLSEGRGQYIIDRLKEEFEDGRREEILLAEAEA